MKNKNWEIEQKDDNTSNNKDQRENPKEIIIKKNDNTDKKITLQKTWAKSENKMKLKKKANETLR